MKNVALVILACLIVVLSFLSFFSIPMVHGFDGSGGEFGNWSWDGTNKILTIVANASANAGDTEANGYDSQDIVNAINYYSWSALYNRSDSGTQFEWYFRIVIGDGSTTTWFIDTNVQWVFADGTVSANSQFLIEGKRYAHIRFGILEDATNKVTSSGVSFISLESTRSSIRFIYTSSRSGSEALLYSCTFDAPNRNHYFATNREADDKIYHCSFSNTNPFMASGDFYDIIVQSSSFGMYATGTMDRIWLGDVSTAMFARYSGAYTFSNVEVKTPYTRLFYLYSKTTNPVYAINVDAPNWIFLWVGTNTVPLYRQYEFDLTVTYPNGTAFQNANVTITYEGQGGGTVGTWLTDSNGQIPTQTLSRSFYNQTGGNTEYPYYPYNLTVTSSYGNYTQKWTPQEKTTWEIALQPPATATAEDESYFWWLLSLTWIPLIIAFTIVRKRKPKTPT